MGETYLAAIKNSVGSKMFKNLWAKVDGKRKDILRDGDLSCAFYASSVLYLFKLIKEIHATVDGTIKDLKNSGWVDIKKPKMGAVLVWAEKDFGKGEKHKHMGFYIGNNQAVSNSSSKKCPKIHNWKIFDGRKIETILWHSKLK